MLMVFDSSWAFSQKQGNIWYFGDGYGLDFNTTPPTLLNDGQTAPSLACGDLHIEGTASIADSSGSLLFYTDGQTIWNKNHQPMPNGTGLLGGRSSTQAALIVPEPESDTRYYVFTTDDFCNDLENGLRYSIVDICEDNKQGDVLEGFKNELLLDTVAEKLAAVRHANGVDYWILTHRYFSNEFYSFQLTSQGIESPVISSIGSVHQGGGANNMWRAMGQMKISSDGSRVAISSANCGAILEVFDFDNALGVISNPLSLPTSCGTYGLEFSPDGSKLYTSGLAQFDLTAGAGHPDSVAASLFEYTDPNLSCVNAIQLGVDGKMYLYDCFDNEISVVNNPNASGEVSDIDINLFIMNTDAVVYGLPAMVAGYDYTISGVCDTGVGIVEVVNDAWSVTAYPNPATTQTQLTYHAPQGAKPTLQLSDMLGRLVKTVQLPSYEGTYTLDASGLGAGVYFCTLLNGTEVLATQKLSVIKYE